MSRQSTATNSATPTPDPALVINTYEAILRTAPTVAYAEQESAALIANTTTVGQLETQLLSQAADSTIPALTVYRAFFGAAPSWSGGLDYLTNYAANLTTHGFSLQNVYVNLAASFITSVPEAPQFAAESRPDFLSQVYDVIFGMVPSQDAVNYLLSRFDYYAAATGSELGARGAIWGVLLSVSDAAGGSFSTSDQAFLTALAGSSAGYGQTIQGGAATVLNAVTNAAASASTAGNPPDTAAVSPGLPAHLIPGDVYNPNAPPLTEELVYGNGGFTYWAPKPDTGHLLMGVTTLGDDATFDPGPGTGGNSIQFIGSNGGDAVVPHVSSTDTISGFDINATTPDVLDFSALFAEVNIATDIAHLGDYVTVTAQGADAAIVFDPSGTWTATSSVLAVLSNDANTIPNLSTLIAHNAVKV